MQREQLESLARQFLEGQIAPDELWRAWLSAGTAELGSVQLDLDRAARCGFPEVIFGDGKDAATIARIIERLLAEGHPILVTRLTVEKGTALAGQFSQGQYNPVARTFRIGANRCDDQPKPGKVAVVAAGTSDLHVAEEACETLNWMGIEPTLIVDVGVAGPQRLLAHVPTLRQAAAVVVVAGMEGALPSVVGGYVPCPVIAVPTSVGYGANFGGVAALLSMLNSCAANVTVVNIDAGFKAGYIAGLIATRSRP